LTPSGTPVSGPGAAPLASRSAPRRACAQRVLPDLAWALREHLAGTPAFTALAGIPIANATGALLDLSPDGRLADLRKRAPAAIRTLTDSRRCRFA
jgi:hypothetical protein